VKEIRFKDKMTKKSGSRIKPGMTEGRNGFGFPLKTTAGMTGV
jgi:hypothetical protein